MEDGSDTLCVPPYHEILTPRLRLRTVYVSDAEALLPMLQQTEVMRWMRNGQALPSLATAERWVKDRALGSDVFNFAIELRHDQAEGSRERPTIIGIMGSFHWPRTGYMINADYGGKGYATEALGALVPELFSRMPAVSSSTQCLGYDYIEALTDSENIASQKVLQKCGFTFCETCSQNFEHPLLGLRDTTVFRIARPSKTLEDLGLIPQGEPGGDDFVPPIQ
ncbi:hypothetical protein KC332_g13750 [Hortaea werneckii]|uniref:N-acetyltransferase domain-containing protein n=2 Tax=Hortaea werneckii TaxID=91943 RepID=A0A3M7IRM6_HORWE|nr:hypothetical protein KC358_g14004 [Hortaea werneckii]OTA39142.1 hypothetical protein BTJ68_00898 [Hortaea werneckii EXF-2000]KAI6808893.1 hypothetical protein KC350_g13146 [Hortaea werneckii]KAI6909394.1 hypothetical protein KC348_g13504 [Hortaea werneckii]KAI6925855.1 hypothetical protein KC341_g13135 [Hortaea werneckii]